MGELHIWDIIAYCRNCGDAITRPELRAGHIKTLLGPGVEHLHNYDCKSYVVLA